MYSRKIEQAPDSPLINNKPLFGTFSGKFKYFDIRTLQLKVGPIQIPQIIGNFRIFESLRFYFIDETYIGEIELFNAHYFSYLEATIWNRKTTQKKAYRKLVVPSFIKMPRAFKNSVVVYRTKSRFVRIQYRHTKLHIDFDFLGSKHKPPCAGAFVLNLESPEFVEASSVIPYKGKQRCQLSYFCSSSAEGWISTGLNDHVMQKEKGLGFFEIKKIHASLRTHSRFLTGFGLLNGQTITFRLTESEYQNQNKYNENIVFFNGKSWPLPPVKITRPYGFNKMWIIQDTESMVDLTFTPKSKNSRKISAFVVRTEYDTILGAFDGVLKLSKDLKIELKEFPGIGKKIILRA